ncbi:MAG: hypothetical protein JW881_08940 [Spirochaetales bacterium]|nr:hypothetical protein [Spirochaetales bacterium]
MNKENGIIMVCMAICMVMMSAGCEDPLYDIDGRQAMDMETDMVGASVSNIGLKAEERGDELVISWNAAETIVSAGVKYTGITGSKVSVVVSQLEPKGIIWGPLNMHESFSGTGSKSWGSGSWPAIYCNTCMKVEIKVQVFASSMYVPYTGRWYSAGTYTYYETMIYDRFCH